MEVSVCRTFIPPSLCRRLVATHQSQAGTFKCNHENRPFPMSATPGQQPFHTVQPNTIRKRLLALGLLSPAPQFTYSLFNRHKPGWELDFTVPPPCMRTQEWSAWVLPGRPSGALPGVWILPPSSSPLPAGPCCLPLTLLGLQAGKALPPSRW